MSTIATPTATRRNANVRAQLDFDFDPHGEAVIFTIGVDTFAPPNVYAIQVNTEITFTADAVMPPRFDPGGAYSSRPPNAQVLEYYWKFGDGTFGYGNPVAHTYNLINSNTQIVLRVTDDQGRQFFVGKQVYADAGSVAGIGRIGSLDAGAGLIGNPLFT
jgi:hypothetical protein